MANFQSFWDKHFKASTPASAFAGISEDGINDYLSGHRKHDKERYLVSRSFEADGKTLFEATIVVGGSKKDHNGNRCKPLSLSLPKGKKAAKLSSGQSLVYNYPAKHGDGMYAYDQVANPVPNIVIRAPDVHLYMAWPNSAGGSWRHDIGGINFELEAKLDLSVDDNRYSLTFTPVRLHVSRTSITEISRALRGAGKAATPAKIDDLVMSIVSLAASALGPDLAQNIAVPIFEWNKFEAFPTAMAVDDGLASVAVKLDVKKAQKEFEARLTSVQTGYLEAFAADMENLGSVEALLWDEKTVMAAQRQSKMAPLDWLSTQPTRSEVEIRKALPLSEQFMAHQLRMIEHRNMAPTKTQAAHPDKGFTAKDSLAIAVSEATLQALVSDIGGTKRSGRTDHISLKMIRGRLGYDSKIGVPKITVGGTLGGSIDVDLFAGLYYQLKQILDCSWRWGKEHRIGLGVKGDPKVKVWAVKNKRGLSLGGKVEIKGLGLQTGLGAWIDKLINALLTPFKMLIESMLKAFLALLSFVVVPIQFSVPDQRTAIKLAGFKQAQYKRFGKADPENNFMSVLCSSKAVSS